MDPEPEPEPLLSMLKKGNKSSAYAMLGNTAIAILKGTAAALSGNGSMFASTMHSIADSVNQGFVFTGSILAEKKPTRRFPTGFGRVINLFCMIAVIVVTVMAYETIREGWHLLQHPAAAAEQGFWLNLSVLIVSIGLDGYVLYKAMKSIVNEARADHRENTIIAAFRHVRRAAPPTRLVFYEDLVATLGGSLAFVAVLITAFTDFDAVDGVVTMIIGLLMVGVAFRVGYDNMVGLIGVAAPRDVEEKVAMLILGDKDVTDINELRITQEGRYYHVDGLIELRRGLSLADADDIKYRVQHKLMSDPDITDVALGIIEDNGVTDWTPEKLDELTS